MHKNHKSAKMPKAMPKTHKKGGMADGGIIPPVTGPVGPPTRSLTGQSVVTRRRRRPITREMGKVPPK